MSEPKEIKKDRTGRVVLWSLLGFFAVFAGVDAFFVYKALNTHTGMVTEDPYEKGLRYNEILKEARERRDEEQRSNQSGTGP